MHHGSDHGGRSGHGRYDRRDRSRRRDRDGHGRLDWDSGGLGHSGLCGPRLRNGRGRFRLRRGGGQRWSFFFSRARGGLCRLRLERQQPQQRHGQRRVLVGCQAQFGPAMQADAVEQLGFVARHQHRKAGDLCGLRIAGVGGHLRHSLRHGHALQHGAHLLQRGGCRQAIAAQRLGGFHHHLAIGLGECLDQAEHMAAVHAAQHLAHHGLLQLAAAKGNGLVGQRQRIAHGAARGARQQAQGLGFGSHAFLAKHLAQMLQHGLGRHGPQVELQAAAEHGHGHLLRIGGGQHELQVLGWLFQRLEHGVEGRVREHVHFVDHEDLEASLHRLVDGLLQQALHLVHPAVGGGVQLGVIGKAAAVDFGTGRTDAAGRCRDAALAIGALAVERLGQNARDRGLAHAARAGEQIGMVQALLRQGIGERLNDMLLPHHFREIAGAVFAGQHKIRHPAILRG